MTAPEWYALGAALVGIAFVIAGTVATRAAHGRRDGQDSERPGLARNRSRERR